MQVSVIKFFRELPPLELHGIATGNLNIEEERNVHLFYEKIMSVMCVLIVRYFYEFRT